MAERRLTLFGEGQYENLPEEVIEVLVDNGIQAAQWEQIGRHINAVERHQQGPRLIRGLKNLGMGAGAVKLIWNAWNHMNQRHGDNKRLEQPLTGHREGLRATKRRKAADEEVKNNLLTMKEREGEGNLPDISDIGPKQPVEELDEDWWNDHNNNPDEEMKENDFWWETDSEQHVTNMGTGAIPKNIDKDRGPTAMEVDGGPSGEEPEAVRAAAPGAGPGGSVSKETPISTYP